jgi:hypothetical protein
MLSSGSDALGLGTSFDGGRSAVSNAGSAAHSPVAALPGDVSVRSDAADFHPTSASSVIAGAGGSFPGSTATDNGLPALSNLGAVDTFRFATDFGQDTGSSLVQSAGVHTDPTTNATSDTSLGSDHVVMADSGIVLGTTHTDPLKDIALASQHGDEFHTA